MKRPAHTASLDAPYEPAGGMPDRVRILLLDLPFGGSIDTHPDVAPRLAEGWRVRRARPRLVEGQGRRHLVVLAR